MAIRAYTSRQSLFKGVHCSVRVGGEMNSDGGSNVKKKKSFKRTFKSWLTFSTSHTLCASRPNPFKHTEALKASITAAFCLDLWIWSLRRVKSAQSFKVHFGDLCHVSCQVTASHLDSVELWGKVQIVEAIIITVLHHPILYWHL